MKFAMVWVMLWLGLFLIGCQQQQETPPIPTLHILASFTPSAEPVIITATPDEIAALPSPTLTTSPTASQVETATLTRTATASHTPTPSYTFSPTVENTPAHNIPSPTATITQTLTAQPTAEGLTARVTAENLNIRNGPGNDFDVIAHLQSEAIVPVEGVSDNSQWLLIQYDDDLTGWVFADFISLNGDLALVPNREPDPLPDTVRLEGMTHLWQRLNNCAPTALTIALSYFQEGDENGRPIPQQLQDTLTQATAYLRPTSNLDVSVDIAEMVRFVNEEYDGVRALWRMGGNWTTIRRLLAAGFPVLIETGIIVTNPPPGQPGGWAGHNRVIMGYDGDDILTYDSYLGHGNFNGYRINQTQLDSDWRELNRNYMVLYPIEREQEVAYLLGADWNLAGSIEHAHRVALAEMAAAREGADYNFFALFNLGTTYTTLGQYQEASDLYDAALELSEPFRIFWYQFGIFEAYYHTGRYARVRSYVTSALQNMGGNAAEELYYWRGMTYAAQGNFDAAKTDLQRAIDFNPNYEAPQQALDEIERGEFKPPV